jgi:beta-glucanase (GH16 family)
LSRNDSWSPSAPGSVTVTSSTTSSIGLSWSPSRDNVGVAGYKIYVDSSVQGTTASTWYTASGLACARTYRLGVQAFDAAGNLSKQRSVYASTAGCVTMPAPTPPPAPTGLSLSGVTGTAATFSWTASAGATSYRVYLGSATLGDTPTTSYALTALTCGTRYTVGVDARSAAGASTMSTSTFSTQACPPSPADSAPAPISGLGYNLADDEEFANLDGWTNHIWYDPAPAAGAVSVANGDLYLTARKTDGWQEVTATTLGHKTFTKGYFEARMRWTKGNGAWPAFWMMGTPSCTDESVGLLCPELDIMEAQGSEPTAYSVALHRNTGGKQGTPDSVLPANGSGWKDYGTDLTDWHTYSALWTDTTITWYLDGSKVASAPVYDSTNQPMFLLLDMWIGGWTTGVDSTTPAQLVTQVDWVKVWQKP